MLEQQNQSHIHYTITFHHMKLRRQISKKAEADLKQILDASTFQTFSKRLGQQKCRDTSYSKMLQNQTIDIKTPSTVDTTLRRRGNAITKSIRPESKSKGKTKITNLIRPSLNSQIAVTRCMKSNAQDPQQSSKLEINGSSSVLNRKAFMDRAVYYGNVQLPYLHSSDAISCLYEKSKAADKNNQEPLINPPSSISPYLLTNLKNLYLYYTPLDSVRQLGTGWSNLKSLTVMCSYLLVDLSGLTIFPSLEYLFVPHNSIREISDIMYHSSLRCVDLQDNRIDLIDQVEYLYTITNLQWVDVSHNPVTQVKEKYRIISQNLGNKMQIEECNRLFQYQMSQKQLDYEVDSYANIEVSNNLIKQINEQIMKQDIKVGEVWRAVQEKILNGITEPPTTADVQIIQSFHYDDEEQGEDSACEDYAQSSSPKKYDRLQLRVTPLIDYTEPTINVAPLKKYFHNKICPQTKPAEKEKECPQVNIDKAQSRQIIQQAASKKFSATQKLTTTTSEQKKRLTSVSLKRRVSKLSLSKNNNFASTVSSVINNLKLKQQMANDLNSRTSPSNLKFLSKRKLISKISQQLI